jgi:hypothetical protein
MAGLSILAAFAYRMSNGGFPSRNSSPFSRYANKAGGTTDTTGTQDKNSSKDAKKAEPPTELEKRITNLKQQIQDLRKKQNAIDRGSLSAQNKAQQKQVLERDVQKLTIDLNRLTADNIKANRLKSEEEAKNNPTSTATKGTNVNTTA